MTFTEARANVGAQLSDAALFAPPSTAPFNAQIGSGSGAITAGVLKVPQFSTFITEPIEANVTVDFEIGTITGSFNQATGALSLTGIAGGTLTATNESLKGEQCTVLAEPSPLTLTTAGSSGGTAPRSGTPFTGGLTGPGAIAGEWENMSATPVNSEDPENVSFCNNVEKRIGGPGGVWLVQKGVVSPPPPPPPPPAACTVPKLAGKTLARAKAALKGAGCKLGKVHGPKRRQGKGRRPLVVKSSSPAAGTTASGKVNLRLGPKPRKARR